MSLIQQQPDTYNFAGNIADIVLTSDASVTLSIPLLLEEVYFPDANGRITIPLQAFFEAHLHAPGLEEIPENGLELTAYTYYIDGQECGTFHVLAGGVDSPSVDTELFLKSNFLTWQPQTRFVTYHEPQWLRYVALQACTVKVKGYFDDGNTATVTLKDLTANKQYNLDVNYGRIRGMFESQPAYYDVWVEAGGERLSFVQRYVLQDEFSTNVDFFVFENSLGGYDTIRFAGDRKEITEAESLNAVFDAETNEYGIDYSKSWTKYTGYLPNERSRLWALEFFSSSRKYHLSDRSLRRIVVSKPKLEATSGEVSGYEFTFAYSHQSRYLNISRDELPDHLEIVGPGDELFFLTPRLNEFPILDTTHDILIPAQYPYSEEWGILSLASLLKSLLNESESGSGTYFHDQLLNLDKANQHPIKAISGLQAALDKKVSVSLYEQFVQTYNNHVLSAVHLTNEQQSILSRFSIVDGRLQIDGDAYTTGWLAQLGAATGEGGTGGSGTMYHELLEHLDWPNQHPIEAITGLQDALNGKASADHVHSWASLTDKPTTLSGFGITDGVDKDSFDTHVRAFDTHANSDAHLTAGQRAVLSMLSVDTDGNLKIDGNAFTTGWLAQLGAATGEGGTGGSGTMYHDQLQHLDWPNQHPIEAITGLQEALNGKLATTAISAWALQPEKPSYTWAEISGKPSAFTPAAHTHGMSEINGLSAALAEKLGVEHASDTTLHLTAGQRAVLSMLSVDTDGNLKIDGNAFTTGWLAQLGAATGEGGTGGGTLYHDELEHLDYPDQHPIAAIVGLQSALNGKASTALVTTSASGLMSATDKAKLDGIAAGANNYVLPIASASVLGGVRVGSRLSIASGVLSANAQAWSEITGKPTTFTPAAHTQGWDTITGKPTTLSGYGITDAMTASAINTALSQKADANGTIIGRGFDSSLNTTEVGTGFQRLSEGSSTVGPYISFGHSGYIAQITVGYTDYSGYSDMLRYRVRNGESASWTDWKTIWHSGNFNPDSKATISGNLSQLFQASQINMGNDGYMRIGQGSTLSSAFGIDEFTLANYRDNGLFTIMCANNPTYTPKSDTNKRYVLWHAGNDGANSGLDADLLDGRHASEFWGHFQTTIDASSLSEDYYYPVTILVSPYCRMRISVIVSLNSGTKPSWSSHGQGFSCRFIEEITGEGWGTIRSNRLILDSAFQFADKNPIGEVWQMTNSNNEVIYVRGGGKYFFYTTEATTITLRTTSFTSGGQTAAPKLVSSLTPAPYKSGAGLIGLSTLYCDSIVIGGHTITWDSTNNALKIDGNVYTTGSITQLKS